MASRSALRSRGDRLGSGAVARLREKLVEALIEVGARLLQLVGRLIGRASLVPTTTFLSTDTFSWIGTLEDNWKVIRRELDGVLEFREQLPNFQDISTDQESITDDDRWKTFFFASSTRCRA